MCTDDVQQEFLSMRDVANGENLELRGSRGTSQVAVHPEALERKMGATFNRLERNRFREILGTSFTPYLTNLNEQARTGGKNIPELDELL